MREKVNSERINCAANRIKTANNTLNTEFSDVKKAAVRMNQKWNSGAARAASDKFNSLIKQNRARSTVFYNYEKVLSQAVAVNHVRSETENKKLSSMFK